jgi:hypothetical protein
VNLVDPDEGLVVLRDELIRLKVPAGTTIEFKRGGIDFSEVVYRQ